MDNSVVQLEKLRKKVAKHHVILSTLSFLVAILSFPFVASMELGIGIFFIIVVIGLGFWFLLGKITGYFDLLNQYKKQFKEILVEIPFLEKFSEVNYKWDQGLDEQVIKNTGIMCLGNIFSSNDYLQGYYKGVKFERADVKIQNRVRTGKTTCTITYLHGRWLIFEFNKSFHSDLQIIGNGFSSSKKKKSIFTEEEERRHRIELEDMEFNEKFDVFCQNEHEAYYILTPHFMSMLKEIYCNMDGNVMFGFIDNQLHVAIDNEKDAMEPKIFEPIEVISINEEVQTEIEVIMRIIDGLDLDVDIYK